MRLEFVQVSKLSSKRERPQLSLHLSTSCRASSTRWLLQFAMASWTHGLRQPQKPLDLGGRRKGPRVWGGFWGRKGSGKCSPFCLVRACAHKIAMVKQWLADVRFAPISDWKADVPDQRWAQ